MASRLDDWLARLESIHPQSMDLGLERVGVVAQAMDLTAPGRPVVTVAGTNGKGSTIAVMEAVLLAVGKSVGVNTSPHFLRFNERIRLSGQEAPDEEIVAAFEAIDAARGDTSLTYFEFSTLAALLIFQRHEVDVILLEVGLGGRLDAANIIDPTVAVITSIDLDHQQWLGNTRGEIAREKAGILRRGIPAIIGEPEPPPELLEAVSEVGARGLWLGRDYRFAPDGAGWRAQLTTQGGQARVTPVLGSGALLPANLCTALQALLLLGESFSDAQLLGALQELAPGGRREARQVAGRDYLLDVAHNPAAVMALGEYLLERPVEGRTIALFSPMADKDIRGMILASAGCFDAWFLADQPAVPRAAAAEDVAGLLRAEGFSMISTSKNIRQAFRRAQGLLGPDDRLVVFGSFFTVADVMRQLDKDLGKSQS